MVSYATHADSYDSAQSDFDSNNDRSFGDFGFHYYPEKNVIEARVFIVRTHLHDWPEANGPTQRTAEGLNDLAIGGMYDRAGGHFMLNQQEDILFLVKDYSVGTTTEPYLNSDFDRIRAISGIWVMKWFSIAARQSQGVLPKPTQHIHSDGDIILTAPNGRVHIQGAFFSREVGDPKKAKAAVAAGSVTTAEKAGVPVVAAPVKPDPKAIAAWRKSHQEAIHQALTNQRKLLLQRKAQLSKWDDTTKAQARTWFGADTWDTRKTLIDRTDKELALNQKMTMNNFYPPEPGKALKPGTYAYVYPTDTAHKVYLASGFDNANPLGTDSKAGTLAHEMSHFNDVSGTKDYVYGTNAARGLATIMPNKAINNADNYEYFVEGISKK